MDRRILSVIFLICLVIFIIIAYMQTQFRPEGRWGFVAMLGENYIALVIFIVVAIIILGIAVLIAKRSTRKNV